MENSKSATGSALKWISVVLIIVIVGIFWNYGFVTVPAGYRGIHHRAGKIIRTLDPGLHFQIPFLDKVVEIETRELNIEKKIECFSSEMMDVSLEIRVRYQLNPDYIKYIYSNFGTSDEIRSKIMDPMITHVIKSIISKEHIFDIHPRRDELADKIREELNNKTKKAIVFDSDDGYSYEFLMISDIAEKDLRGHFDEVEIFNGRGHTTGYLLENEGGSKWVYTYDSLFDVSRVDISNIHYSDALEDGMRKIQMAAEQNRKIENQQEVSP